MKSLFQTKTKIVATIGPSSNDVPTIKKMLEAGMTVARINMSHGDHADKISMIENVRQAAQETGRPVAILQDLSGPKIRIGDFTTETVTLQNGHKLVLTTKACDGTVDKVFVNYPKLPSEVDPGMDIYLNDGKQLLRVDRVTTDEVHTTVVVGGTIRGRRGVNIPDGRLSISSLTEKDKKDLKLGLAQKVDFVTLSFVRTVEDIHELKRLIGKNNIPVVAKIETKTAMENIEAIVEAADAFMVARGDLAVEVPLEKVPLYQKRIIRLANRAGKPVITATQMLDSMRESTTPTRAEVTDIATAILDGTDAIMLSDESAIGKHPPLAISIMTRVAREIEQDPECCQENRKLESVLKTPCDVVSHAIVRAIKPLQAKAIVALSESGHTGRMIARHRPSVPVLVITPHQYTYNKMLLVYGCEPVLVPEIKGLDTAQKAAREEVLARKLAKKGDTFILGAGIPFGKTGATNTMLVEKV